LYTRNASATASWILPPSLPTPVALSSLPPPYYVVSHGVLGLIGENTTYLSSNDLADFPEPDLGIELFAAENLFGQVVEVGDFTSLFIGREDVDGFREGFTGRRTSSEDLSSEYVCCTDRCTYLCVTTDAKDTDIYILVGVGVKVLLDLVGDLRVSTWLCLTVRETHHLRVGSDLGLLNSLKLGQDLFIAFPELVLLDERNVALAKLRKEGLHSSLLVLALEFLDLVELGIELLALSLDFVGVVSSNGDDSTNTLGD
jgi:hypothetical protein